MTVDHVYLGSEFEHQTRSVVTKVQGRLDARPEICRISKFSARSISWIDEHGRVHTTPRTKFDAIVGRWLL